MLKRLKASTKRLAVYFSLCNLKVFARRTSCDQKSSPNEKLVGKVIGLIVAPLAAFVPAKVELNWATNWSNSFLLVSRPSENGFKPGSVSPVVPSPLKSAEP